VPRQLLRTNTDAGTTLLLWCPSGHVVISAILDPMTITSSNDGIPKSYLIDLGVIRFNPIKSHDANLNLGYHIEKIIELV